MSAVLIWLHFLARAFDKFLSARLKIDSMNSETQTEPESRLRAKTRLVDYHQLWKLSLNARSRAMLHDTSFPHQRSLDKSNMFQAIKCRAFIQSANLLTRTK